MDFNQDDLEVRLKVTLTAIITVGVYSGPITKVNIAQHVDNLFEAAGGSLDLISGVEVASVHLDDGTQLVETE